MLRVSLFLVAGAAMSHADKCTEVNFIEKGDLAPKHCHGGHTQECLQAMDNIAQDLDMKDTHHKGESLNADCEANDLKDKCSDARSKPITYADSCEIDCVNKDDANNKELDDLLATYKTQCGNTDNTAKGEWSNAHAGELCYMDMIVEYPNGGRVTYVDKKILCIPGACSSSQAKETIRQSLEFEDRISCESEYQKFASSCYLTPCKTSSAAGTVILTLFIIALVLGGAWVVFQKRQQGAFQGFGGASDGGMTKDGAYETVA